MTTKRNQYICRNRPQRKWKFVLLNLFIVAVFVAKNASCNTVSIVSGFEKKTLENGANFTLRCKATGLYHVTITWLLDGVPLEYQRTKAAESVRMQADNPHLGAKGNDDRGAGLQAPRYMIKNSNELADDVNESNDVTGKDIIKTDIEYSAEEHNDSRQPTTVINERTNTPIESPSQPQGFMTGVAPVVLSNLDGSENGAVTIASELTMNGASVQDGGVYSCVARDVTRESISWSRKIAVKGPLSVRQNRPIFALINSVVTIPCTVLGSGEDFPVKWSYQKFSNGNANAESNQISLPNDHRQTVHPNGNLEIREARKANEGIYTCQVDLNGILSNMSTPLKVMVPPKIKSFVLPQVQVGKPLAEFCVVSEGDFPLDIAWFKNGILLRPTEYIDMHRSGKRALSLTISSVTLDSAGNYSCCAANNVSRTCIVSPLVVLDPPKIRGLSTQESAISGNDVTIPCHATGFPKPNVTWMRVLDDSTNDYLQISFINDNNKPIKDNPVKIGQTKNGTLVIRNVSDLEAGKYLCRAVNQVDELSRFVTLQVHNPARIVDITGTQDVVYGSDVTIECASWGDDIVQLKWLKSNKELPSSDRYVKTRAVDYRKLDARHSITLHKLKIKNSIRGDTGTYSCKVMNKYGASTRHLDILVRSPPMIPSKFELIDKGTSFLRMVVLPGEDDGGSELLSYVLTATKVYEETSPEPPEFGQEFRQRHHKESQIQPWTLKYPVSATSPNQEIVLDQLECGTEYEMFIKSENQIGESFQQVNLTEKTIGSVPVIPVVNEIVVDVNQSAVVLDLRAWQNGGCPITELTIEYARHGDTEWNITVVDSAILENVLSSSHTDDGGKISPNPGHVIISNLQVGTWYKVWTSACNNAGCNYVTHSVATLRSDGATVPPLKVEIDKKEAATDDARFLVPMVCGFGLVFLLALILLFYRHKQRSKKQLRMKEARKMARTLLYKTDDKPSYAPRSNPSNQQRFSSNTENDDVISGVEVVEDVLLIRTSTSSESDNESGLRITSIGMEVSSITEPYADDNIQQQELTYRPLNTLANHGGERIALSSSHSEKNAGPKNSSSGESKKSEGKKSLKDNVELAVFRDPISSDDEDHESTLPLVCDESAFGDSGTWSYFQPGSKARRPKKKYNPIPTKETQPKPIPRRCSSTSSGTDEELAQVFGLTSSKRKFKPVSVENVEQPRNIPESANSDINDNYKPITKDNYLPNKQNIGPVMAQNGPQLSTRRTDHYYAVGNSQDRSHSASMLQQRGSRPHKALPQDSMHTDNRRPHIPMQVQNRPVVPNLNPFKTMFKPTGQLPVPINLHRPSPGHYRGHTFSNDQMSHHLGQNTAPYKDNLNNRIAPYGTNTLNSSPYGERQWVNSYDSQYGTAKSKRPSWGSTELDKECFYTPPSSNVSSSKCDPHIIPPPKYQRPLDIATNPSTRKLESNSPRDSGIGSDEAPSSRNTTSSVSPPQMKGRNEQEKSLESLDEVISQKGNRSSSCSSSGAGAIYSMTPPPTPPASEAKLTPHIFVDISSKCNTTPTRTSRQSYPPSIQVPNASYRHHLTPPTKLGEYLPTPPPSGPTSPTDKLSIPRPRKSGGWGVANLDGLGKYQNKSDSHLAENEITEKRSRAKIPDRNSSDTTYRMNNDDNTWQASTLV
uniref:uncharacterized protein LOC120335542 n=1 Tax=Styela clava TaxID=7725 RepID=UPI0019399C27|nr:uncharacterized protein LOC120335542 [Styela clava]